MQEGEEESGGAGGGGLRVLHTQARLLSKQFLHESAITIALTALADTKQYRHAPTRALRQQQARAKGEGSGSEFQTLLKQYTMYLEAQFLVGSVLDEAQQYRRAQAHLQLVRKGLEHIQHVLEKVYQTPSTDQQGTTIRQDFLNRCMPHGVVPTKGMPNFLNYAYVIYKIARCHFAVGELEEMFQMVRILPSTCNDSIFTFSFYILLLLSATNLI